MTRNLHFSLTLVVVLCVGPVSSLFGFPSLTPHPHDAPLIAWEKDGTKDGNSTHNHRSARDFGGAGQPREPYSSAACWDNKTYRIDAAGAFDGGHCFVDEGTSANIPLYAFVGTWPAAAKDRVREAFAAWSAVTSDNGSRPTGVAFQEAFVQTPDIEVVWENQSGLNNGGFWDSGIRKLRFDSSMSWFLSKEPAGIPNGQWHFFSVALHETGHVVGLDHGTTAANLMTAPVGQPPDVPGHRHFTAVGASATEGVRDLYSQPNPLPPPQVADCSAIFLGCPYGCNESPYLMSWSAANAMEYEVQQLWVSWNTLYIGPLNSLTASTGTSNAEFFRVRGRNSSGVGPWCNIILHVQCSPEMDPW